MMLEMIPTNIVTELFKMKIFIMERVDIITDKLQRRPTMIKNLTFSLDKSIDWKNKSQN